MRFNADKRRLYEASGCAGKLPVFAVARHVSNSCKERTFYISNDSVSQLAQLRKQILSTFKNIPEVGEICIVIYIDVSAKYGKDTFLSIKHLGDRCIT